MTRVAVVVAAGGSGRRMGGMRKQYLELAGKPVLLRALEPFLGIASVRWIIVALPSDDVADPPEFLVSLGDRVRLVAGGHERTDSVRAALQAVPEEADVVLIHDAARPLVTPDVIERAIQAAAAGLAAVPGVPVEDTIKRVDEGGRIVDTLERERLWRAQTPQAFPRELILRAHAQAEAEGVTATDDAALVERVGGTVVVVPGSPENIKLTSPSDLALAEAILRTRSP